MGLNILPEKNRDEENFAYFDIPERLFNEKVKPYLDSLRITSSSEEKEIIYDAGIGRIKIYSSEYHLDGFEIEISKSLENVIENIKELGNPEEKEKREPSIFEEAGENAFLLTNPVVARNNGGFGDE